jgi:hypothetical protein
MLLPIEGYLVTPAPFVALVTFAILLLCRNRVWFSRLWWAFFVGAGALAGICSLLYFFTPSSRASLHGRGFTPAVGPDLGTLLAILAVIGIESLILFPAFPVMVITALLPPKPISVARRFVVLAFAIAWVVAMGLSIEAKNTAYLANFREESREREQKRREEFDRLERTKPVPPDPKKGPQNEREWRYLGATPTYNRATKELEGLDWDGGGIGRPFPREAIESLKFAGSLKSLTLRGIADADLLHVNRLNHLDHLVLVSTKVTDAGLQEITRVQGLRSLHINGALITDESLATFLRFPDLHSVEAVRTRISLGGLQKFRLEHANDERLRKIDLRIRFRR